MGNYRFRQWSKLSKTSRNFLSSFGSRLFLVFMAMLLVFTQTLLITLADPMSSDEIQALNQWTNWVADQCGSDGSTSGVSSGGGAITPGPVYIMGDSITALAKSTYDSKFSGNGWSPTINGLSSRQIQGGVNPDGLTALDNDKSTVSQAQAIVIALGTNGVTNSGASTKALVEKAMAKIKGYDTQNAPIFWVNVLDTNHDAASKTTNQAIKDGVGSDGTVIDWYSEAKSKADLASFNGGVHPTKQQDIDLLVNLVYSDVIASGGGVTSSTGPAPSVSPVTSSSTPKNGQSLGGVAGTGFTQSEIDKAKSASSGSSFSGGSGFRATTYGPPWSAQEGGGVTSTGLNLKGPDNSHGMPRYEIAVDPHVIPYGSLVTVWPNAVNWHGAFLAGDTGGAINGNHVDVYDWSGDGTKDSFTANNAKVEPYTGSMDSSPTSDPAATTPGDQTSCCSSGSSATQSAVTGNLDITQIATKYNLQSAMIQEQGGSVLANYHADESPSTPASTMKLIIADTALQSGIDLNKTVSIGSDVYYNGSNDLGTPHITLGNAMDKMLSVSSNVGANVLMKELGGVSAFTSKANGYGYTHTTVKGYYDPSNDGKNSSTISDEVAAMNHLFTASGSGYGVAQNALQAAAHTAEGNYYGVDDTANKWAGTSTVAGNVGNFKVNGKDYIIGLYINGSDSSSTVKSAVKNASADLASAIQGGSGGQAPDASATGTSCCNGGSENVPAGTLPSFIPEPYNGAFTQGANNHNVAPALVAALFSEEHNLGNSETDPDTKSLPAAWANFAKSHPDPNSGWAGSSAGAQGPFQFLTSTFTGLGYDASKINNLVTAADAAAKYAQSDGATKDKPEASWKTFIFSYNHADWYVKAVLQYYDYYNGQPGATPGAPTAVGTPSTDTSGCANGGGSAVQQQVVSIAKQELALWNSGKMTPGFHANSSNSFSKYSQNVDDLWCAFFVSWVYDQAHHPLQTSPSFEVGLVSNIQGIGMAQKQGFHWHTKGDGYTPQPGDIAIHGGGHTNILVSVSGSKTTYIGGDQGGGPYPDGSSVTTEPGDGYYSGGITGYVSLN